MTLQQTLNGFNILETRTWVGNVHELVHGPLTWLEKSIDLLVALLTLKAASFRQQVRGPHHRKKDARPIAFVRDRSRRSEPLRVVRFPSPTRTTSPESRTARGRPIPAASSRPPASSAPAAQNGPRALDPAACLSRLGLHAPWTPAFHDAARACPRQLARVIF